MSRRLPVLLALAALVGAAAAAAIGAWREATPQGWIEDGFWRLVLDAFWQRFDPWAGIAFGVAMVGLLAAWLAGRWRPAQGGLRAAVALVAVAGLLRLGALALDRRGPGLPNVVLISIDTLRADRLGAYGHTLPTSPAFDRRLAGEGVVFERAFSQSPKTTPSHMTMLTSLYPAVHGIELWDGVHDPYAPPPELVARFDGEYGEGPITEAVRRIRGGVDGWERGHTLFWDAVDESNPRDVRFISRLYDAGIRRMDDVTLTALLDELDALGVSDDTLVIFTSDHGEAFGEHGRFLHGDLYEGTLHVPLVLRFPGRLPRGARVAQRTGLVDLMPTVLELLGIAPPRICRAAAWPRWPAERRLPTPGTPSS